MISTKPTIYLIDALNFLRSFLQVPKQDEEKTLRALIDALNDTALTEYKGSTFRLIIDGGFRNIGPTETENVDALFSEEQTADEIILEQALFLKRAARRVCVVTYDRGITNNLREEGIKILSCEKFFDTFLS
ncbi:MAG: NYN domain-containing protein [Elusimicrobiaceae bacterium]|nr:NYN domain-containing protein [Elusimicrobiaceae bacterium]